MNKAQIDAIASQATDDILGVPVLDRYKFAELVVRECVTVIHKRIGPKSAVDLLEHFEIKE